MRQAASATACLDRSIVIGQSITSSLSLDTCAFILGGNTHYTQVYAFNAQAGDQVAVSLRSTGFDSFLRLVGPDRVQMALNDNGGGGTDARIPAGAGYLLLPATGTYQIVVSSTTPQGTGPYTLQLISECDYSIWPTTASSVQSGGIGSISVFAGSGCSWSAFTNVPWITLTSVSAAVGHGIVTYQVAPNDSATPRSGTLTVANRSVTISQEPGASTCFSSVSPLQIVLGNRSTIEDISVVVSSGCIWGAASNVSWISLVTGGVGNGTGIARISIAGNSTSERRTGTVSIAGQTVTIVQEPIACIYILSADNSLGTHDLAAPTVSARSCRLTRRVTDRELKRLAHKLQSTQ